MKKILSLAVGIALFSPLLASADEAKVKQLITAKLNGREVTSVKKSYAGLYEVVANNQVLYTDEAAQYVIFGSIINADTKQDLTAQRMAEINRVDFAKLPFHNAVKTITGNGKRVIAIFEDPNCGYCKRLRETLTGMKDLTVYSFMVSYLGDDSRKKSRDIWCAPNKADSWDAWMLRNQVPNSAPNDCKDPTAEVTALGHKLRVAGTPTIIFKNGSRVPGAIDAKRLEEKLSAISNN